MSGETSSTPMSGAKFVTDQTTGEFRASKFVGLDVYGSDNEKIGDISEVLIDGQGNAKAVVIGVGGFLGLGQKSVAVPWASLTWVNDQAPARSASNNGPATTGSMTPPPGGGSPMNAPSSSTASRSPAEQAAYNGYPDHAMVSLTKAELQAAPAFRYFAETSAGGTTNATPPTTTRQ